MREGFDPQRFYKTLPYGLTVPSECPGVTRIEFICEGDHDQLDHYLRDTPFTLASNHFVVGFADRRNARAPLFEANLTVPVKFRDRVGGYPLVVLESSQRMVFGGREKWGYPKLYSEMSMNISAKKISAVAKLGGVNVLELDWEDDASKEPADFIKPVVSPHLLVRVLPGADHEGIDFCDVISRNVGVDFKLKRLRYGSGRIWFGNAPQTEINENYAGIDTGFSGIKISRVIAARCIEGDWYSTVQNGWGKPIERFV